MQLVTKLVAGGVLAAAGLLPVSPIAGAQSVDYGETCTMAFTPPSPFTPGATVTIDGDGFQPNFTTEILFDGTPAQAAGASAAAPVTTDALGSFTIAIVVPPSAAPGAHVITAMCSDDATFPNQFPVQVLGQVASTTTTAAPGGRTATPRTGSDTGPLVAAGIVTVMVGTTLVLAARRRRDERIGA